MIRKIIIFIGILSVPLSVYCQREAPYNLPGFDNDNLHLGYFAGLNSMNFLIEPNEGFLIYTTAGPGISVGLASSFRIAKFLDIKFLPGLSFGQRNLIIRDTTLPFTPEPDWNVKLESAYIDLPIHLKYRAKRHGNYAPYLLGGLAPKFDIFGGQLLRDRHVMRLLKLFDFSPEIGVGIDLYLYKVKMATELKFSVGQLNIFTPAIEDEAFKLYDNSIKHMRSQKVSLTFQFLGR